MSYVKLLPQSQHVWLRWYDRVQFSHLRKKTQDNRRSWDTKRSTIPWLQISNRSISRPIHSTEHHQHSSPPSNACSQSRLALHRLPLPSSWGSHTLQSLGIKVHRCKVTSERKKWANITFGSGKSMKRIERAWKSKTQMPSKPPDIHSWASHQRKPMCKTPAFEQPRETWWAKS